MRLHSQSLHLLVGGDPDPRVTVTGDHVIVDIDGDVDLVLEFASRSAAWDWFAAHLIALHDTESAQRIERFHNEVDAHLVTKAMR